MMISARRFVAGSQATGNGEAVHDGGFKLFGVPKGRSSSIEEGSWKRRVVDDCTDEAVAQPVDRYSSRAREESALATGDSTVTKTRSEGVGQRRCGQAKGLGAGAACVALDPPHQAGPRILHRIDSRPGPRRRWRCGALPATGSHLSPLLPWPSSTFRSSDWHARLHWRFEGATSGLSWSVRPETSPPGTPRPAPSQPWSS